jgi:mannose-1-phosphate guanylyltransferase
MSILAAILSVGLGSRLWPISREHYPKSFTKLEDGQSLLQKAFLRADSITSIDEIMTVARQILRKGDGENEVFILEKLP